MSERLVIYSSIDTIAETFRIDSINAEVTPNYNVAPGQNIAVVINDGQNKLVSFKWCFAKHFFMKEIKPDFKGGANTEVKYVTSHSAEFENQRCIIVADGYYLWKKLLEKRPAILADDHDLWKKLSKKKTPYFFRLKSGKPMGLAGLYARTKTTEGNNISITTIITTNAHFRLKAINPIMPVILPENQYGLWLNPNQHDKDVLLPLLKDYPGDELEFYPVTDKVKLTKNNSAENIKPVLIVKKDI